MPWSGLDRHSQRHAPLLRLILARFSHHVARQSTE